MYNTPLHNAIFGSANPCADAAEKLRETAKLARLKLVKLTGNDYAAYHPEDLPKDSPQEIRDTARLAHVAATLADDLLLTSLSRLQYTLDWPD